MALVAWLAKSSAVNIVCAMTAMTCRGGLNFGGSLCFVTSMTIKALMCPGQRKFGLFGVVKTPERPTVGIMAETAGCAQRSLVTRVLVTRLTGESVSLKRWERWHSSQGMRAWRPTRGKRVTS